MQERIELLNPLSHTADMKRHFKPRELALMSLPAIGLCLIAFWFGTHSPPPGAHEEQQEAIGEAALLQFIGSKDNSHNQPRTIYLAVEGHDASHTFTERMSRHKILIRPISETSIVKSPVENFVIENKTGERTSRYQIQPVVWKSSIFAEIAVSYFSADLKWGKGHFSVNWNGQRWVSDEGETQQIAVDHVK